MGTCVRGAAAVLLAAVTACGSGSGTVVRPPSSPVATTPVPTPSATVAPGTAGPSATAARHQVVRVAPATQLVQGQVVTVTGSGYTPGEALVVVQCLSRGPATGSSDCNVPGLVSVHADARGTVSARLAVSKGPYGSPPLMCSPAHPCLVSVSQAQLNPTEEADASISFR